MLAIVSSIFTALGIDSTLFIQLGIYLVAYFFLYYIVFKPYFLASEERRTLTSGSLDDAKKSNELIEQAEIKYQKRSRQINDEVSFLFNEQRSLAVKESDKLLAEAQTKGKEIISKAQQQVALQIENAEAEFNKSTKEVSAAVVEQMLSRRGGA